MVVTVVVVVVVVVEVVVVVVIVVGVEVVIVVAVVAAIQSFKNICLSCFKSSFIKHIVSVQRRNPHSLTQKIRVSHRSQFDCVALSFNQSNLGKYLEDRVV